MSYCIVENCGSVWTPNSNIKFHNFPKDVERRNRWLSLIPIKGKFYSGARICSKHFKTENYDPNRPGCLLTSAVPFNSAHPCKTCSIEPSTSIAQPNIRSASINTDTICIEILKHGLEEKFPDANAERELPKKRPHLKDFNVQVKLKSPREIDLEKTIKTLQQKIRRQEQRLRNMEKLKKIVRKYRMYLREMLIANKNQEFSTF